MVECWRGGKTILKDIDRDRIDAGIYDRDGSGHVGLYQKR